MRALTSEQNKERMDAVVNIIKDYGEVISSKDIADILGVPIPGFKSWLHRYSKDFPKEVAIIPRKGYKYVEDKSSDKSDKQDLASVLSTVGTIASTAITNAAKVLEKKEERYSGCLNDEGVPDPTAYQATHKKYGTDIQPGDIWDIGTVPYSSSTSSLGPAKYAAKFLVIASFPKTAMGLEIREITDGWFNPETDIPFELSDAKYYVNPTRLFSKSPRTFERGLCVISEDLLKEIRDGICDTLNLYKVREVVREVPVEKIVEKPVEVIKEVPVEKVVEKEVEVPVYLPEKLDISAELAAARKEAEIWKEAFYAVTRAERF